MNKGDEDVWREGLISTQRISNNLCFTGRILADQESSTWSGRGDLPCSSHRSLPTVCRHHARHCCMRLWPCLSCHHLAVMSLVMLIIPVIKPASRAPWGEVSATRTPRGGKKHAPRLYLRRAYHTVLSHPKTWHRKLLFVVLLFSRPRLIPLTSSGRPG